MASNVLVIKVSEEDLSEQEGVQVIQDIARNFDFKVHVQTPQDEAEEERFWDLGMPNQQNLDDLEKSKERLIPIVDEEAGGIIGYILPEHADDVIQSLNDAMRIKTIGE